MPRAMNRRDFFRTTGASPFVMGASGTQKNRDGTPHFTQRSRFSIPRIVLSSDVSSRVGLIKGNDRKQNMLECLDQIKGDIRQGIGNKQVVIKTNFTMSNAPADTHVEIVRAICDTISPFYTKKIIVTESQGGQRPVQSDWAQFDYYALEDEYNIELRDGWDDPHSPLTILDWNWQPRQVLVNEFWRSADVYLISAAVLKRHVTAVVSLSLKNVLMGSIWNQNGINHRVHMHVGMRWDNPALSMNRWDDPVFAQQFQLDQFLIGQHTAPDLAVIDGWEGMEIEETHGPLVDSRLALASTDFLAADRVGCALMNVDFEHVGALNHCYNASMGNADLRKIQILGHTIDACRKRYREDPRTTIQRLHWKTE
jgi:uncharacterized protein (DUF362 family)